MELRQLQSLIAITEKGSFAQAAEHLAYTQPTLTTHIQSLEKELQVKLFDRLGQRVRLTREGERFLVYAERIMKLTEEAAQAVSPAQDTYGKIIIGASETFSVVRLPALLKEFRNENPWIDIELHFGDIAKFYDDLKNNVIDVAFILAGKVPYPDLKAELLCPEPMAFIAAPEHSLARQTLIEVTHFEKEDFIVTQAGCAFRSFIENLLEKNDIKPRSYMKVKNIEAIKQFVISGLGVAILPRIYVEKEIADNYLAELPWHGPDPGMYTQLIYHKSKWLSPALQEFLQLTNRHVGCQFDGL